MPDKDAVTGSLGPSEPLERFQAELMRSELTARLVDGCAAQGLTVRVEGDWRRVVIEVEAKEPIFDFTWQVFDGAVEIDYGVWQGSEASLRAMLAERWGDGAMWRLCRKTPILVGVKMANLVSEQNRIEISGDLTLELSPDLESPMIAIHSRSNDDAPVYVKPQEIDGLVKGLRAMQERMIERVKEWERDK